MAEALKMIKHEFGPQAVILSARDIHQRKGVFGWLKSPGVEVTAAIDTQNAAVKTKTEPVVGRRWTLQNKPSAASHRKTETYPARSHSMASKTPSRYRSAAGERKADPARHKDHLIQFLNLYEELVAQGVEEALASEVIERLRQSTLPNETLEDDAIRDRLTEALKRQGASEGSADTPRDGRRVLVLVGPTGVGKTTTMAKIAVAEAFHKGKQIALMTLNDQRIGATAQMEAYGNILGVPVTAVSNRAELGASLKRFKKTDLILIDTPGISPNDIYGIDELNGLLESVEGLEVHLVVNAGTRPSDFYRIFRKFNLLPIHRLLFTKVDETDEYGPMLSALIRTRLPLSYLTNGQQVPENIEIGSLSRLMSLLLSARKRPNSVVQGRDDNTMPRSGSEGRKNTLREGTYVANKNSDLFHHPYCKWVERIDKRNMLVFKTRSEAVANHFHPCRACHGTALNDEAPLVSATGSDSRMQQMAAY